MKPEEFQSSIMEKLRDSMSLFILYLGQQSDLFKHLENSKEPITYQELSKIAQTNERMTKEFLECCAVNGFVKLENNKYSMFEGYADVLINKDSPMYTFAVMDIIKGTIKNFDKMLNNFKTGEGVEYSNYKFEDCIYYLNRGVYDTEMESWIHKLKGMEEILKKGGRVLDIGCGLGPSSIKLGKLYPNSEIIGLDIDEESIMKANQMLKESKLTNVKFTNQSLEQFLETKNQKFDLISLFECFHDIGNPQKLLIKARTVLNEGGRLIISEERVQEDFRTCIPNNGKCPTLSENFDHFVESLNYNFSVLHCLPASMTEKDSMCLGTCVKPSKVMKIISDSGYNNVNKFHSNTFWNFYNATSQQLYQINDNQNIKIQLKQRC